MSKHTNEVWNVERDGDHFMVCTDMLEICTIQPVDRGGVKSFYCGDETIANAMLISAAPELLEALSDVVEWLELGDHEGPMHSKCIAAIKKARGEQC